MAVQIQFRRDLAAAWTSANPVLAEGEFGLETDTGQFKVGNGVDAWNALAYGGIVGPQGAAGPIVPLGSLTDVDTAGANDNDALVYNATDSEWQPVASASFSKLVTVKHSLLTSTEVFTGVVGGGDVAVSLSITHEVSDPANLLIISAFIGAAANVGKTGEVGIAINDGTGFIAVGDADGVRTRITVGGRISTAGTLGDSVVATPSCTFVHIPGAGSKTYTVHAFNLDSLVRNLYINRTESDQNFTSRPRTVSSLVIQEVSL